MCGRDFQLRLIDVTVSAAALILASPLIILTSALILLVDGPPVFHTHLRYGRGGKRFSIIKFKTLTDDYPLITRHYASEKSIKYTPTKTGKILRRIHLNELPQLINVLKGEMSLVGPRPVICATNSKDAFGERVIKEREKLGLNKLLPGVTGFTQLEGSDLPFERLIELDSKYLEERSVSLNLKLIARTASYLARNLLKCLKL